MDDRARPLAGAGRFSVLLVLLTAAANALDETLRFAMSVGLPTISEAAPFTEARVLLTYGPDIFDAYKGPAVQIDKLMKGEKARELPFEQPGKFDLTLNMKTAKALGLISRVDHGSREQDCSMTRTRMPFEMAPNEPMHRSGNSRRSSPVAAW